MLFYFIPPDLPHSHPPAHLVHYGMGHWDIGILRYWDTRTLGTRDNGTADTGTTGPPTH